MSTLKVNAIRGTGASSDAISVNSTDGTCTVKATNNLSNRNLVINGGCTVAQRATSATVSANGYHTVDRFYIGTGGEDEDVTAAQGTVASGTTPYNLGFRNCLKVTNGNQSSGAGTHDYCEIMYQVEAQDVANSGWNYTSASSYVTLSFWVKSSVAQNFYGFFLTRDGTNRNYPFETGSLSADTWTKITKTIPGSTNVQFDNNNGQGITLEILPFYGTNFTNNSSTVNTWINWDGNAACPDNTSTWWTTNDATFEITGLQIEVGDVATDFEHRSYGDELAKCQRYYYLHGTDTGSYGLQGTGMMGLNSSTITGKIIMWFPVPMRTKPSATYHTANEFRNDTGLAANDSTFGAIWADATSVNCAWVDFPGGSGSNFDSSKAVMVYSRSGSNAKMAFSAEL